MPDHRGSRSDRVSKMEASRYNYHPRPASWDDSYYENVDVYLPYDEFEEQAFGEPYIKAEGQGRRMAGTPQYTFPPPPPAPPSATGFQQHQFAYPQPPQYQAAQRGGANLRGGRGGHGGRADFSVPSPHTPNNYNGPPHSQGPPSTQYNPYNPTVYIGPQAPHTPGGQNAPQGGGYQPPQWQHNQHNQHHPSQHSTPHGQPQQMHQAPAPAPLSAQNYHPNYAPPTYQQSQQPHQPQYGSQQPHQFQHSHPPHYGHSVPPSPQPPHPQHQWGTPPQHSQPQFGSNRGRGRGGHEAPLMGPPIRMGFDNDRGSQMPQASNGFPLLPYPPAPTSHAVPYTPPSYQGYSPHFTQGGGPRPLDSNQFNSGSHRGRGNNMNSRGRGRGDSQFQRGNNHRFSSQQPSEVQKPAVAEQIAKQKNKKKRRTNTLGLTPNGVEHEESEDEVDDVDEEARLVTLLGPDTPQMPADLSAWLAERKARFPTKARREAAEEEQRKRREEEKIKKEPEEKPVKTEPLTELEKQQRKAEKLRLELEKAERRIQDTISGGKRKREDGDEGDSDSTSNSEPETASSRLGGPMSVPPPPKAQLQRHCKYFSTGGTCGKKGKCRFVHDQEVRNQALKDKEANGGKMTLAQRLILNDTAKDDLTILKSIKYLKEKGLMPEQSASASLDEMDIQNGIENPYSETHYGEV